MPDTQRSFTVHAPMDIVLDYLRDFTRAQEWDPGTKSCVRLDEGPIAVGSRWHNVSHVAGKDTELEYTLQQLDRDRLIFIGQNASATSTDDIALTALGIEDTEVTYTSHIEFHGLAKLAGPLLAHRFEQLGDDTQANLVRILNGL